MRPYFNRFHRVVKTGVGCDKNDFCLVILFQYGGTNGNAFGVRQLLIQNNDINFFVLTDFQPFFARIGDKNIC